MTTEARELERLRSERDLYLRLLSLGLHDDLRPLLEEAMSLFVEVTGAKKGYLALYGEESDLPSFWIARSYSKQEVEDIHQKISKGRITRSGCSICKSARRAAHSQRRMCSALSSSLGTSRLL